MKNAWLNLTSLSQVSPIEKKLWIILFWITPINLDTALTQKRGLAWITRCIYVDESDVALRRRHDRSPWMWNFVWATKGGPPTRLGYAAHVLNRGAASFLLIQACRQRTRNEEMYKEVCMLWDANSEVLWRGRKGCAYQICQLKSNQVPEYHRSGVLLRCFQVAPLTPSKSLKTVYRPQ